jgi:hypothetical protein
MSVVEKGEFVERGVQDETVEEVGQLACTTYSTRTVLL